ncbi:hypothetical protein AB0M43_23875 [Longispora sp. NPDC051575]|uniref:hypothetical protein n=1 Tax=Longispora sp. NPDC051575 TaxID=3154943 RepID=UPI003414D4D7
MSGYLLRAGRLKGERRVQLAGIMCTRPGIDQASGDTVQATRALAEKLVRLAVLVINDGYGLGTSDPPANVEVGQGLQLGESGD